MVGLDIYSCSTPLDAGEVAVSEEQGQQIPLSGLGGLLNMLDRACSEFTEVKKELKEVTSIGADLKSLCEGQKRMERTISEVQKDHKEANKQHTSGIIQHDKDIIVLTNHIEACQKDAKDLQEAVKALQKDMGGIYVKMAFVAGGVALAGWLVIQAIAVWDKMPHPRTSTIITSELQRGRV